MRYSQIDPEISRWVQKHAFKKLFTGAGGEEARSVYVSSQEGECFQIWIEYPANGLVRIHAAHVETRHDEEFRKDWEVPIAEVSTALDETVKTVHLWMGRNKKH